MDIVKKNEMQKIAFLFDGWQETLIWSCLQGYMGYAWTDDIHRPSAARIITADFCFFAGKPNMELVKDLPKSIKFLLIVPQNEAWASLIEQAHRGNCRRITRYAIKKEPDVFDPAKLRAYESAVPEGYSIRKIDEELYGALKTEEWSKDFCSQFPTGSDFYRNGLGFVAVHDGAPVSGASSYTVYDKGIEIEVDTKKEFRRKRLALACASALILECLKRGLYPSWDAANKESVALSEKLGYHFDKEYATYEIIK